MTPDETAAAERLRSYAAGKPMKEVWPLLDLEYPPDDQRRDDRRILADAWLSDHPADDGEAFDCTSEPSWKTPADNYVTVSDGKAWLEDGSGYDVLELCEIKTKGQLRCLLAALGIEAKP